MSRKKTMDRSIETQKEKERNWRREKRPKRDEINEQRQIEDQNEHFIV